MKICMMGPWMTTANNTTRMNFCVLCSLPSPFICPSFYSCIRVAPNECRRRLALGGGTRKKIVHGGGRHSTSPQARTGDLSRVRRT